MTSNSCPRDVSPAVFSSARPLLDAGFLPFDELLSAVSDELEYGGDLDAEDLTEAELRTQLAKLWDARVAEQVTWSASDADRLDAAFAELEANGVIARQNFTCCGSCGHYEMGALERPRWAGVTPPTGYVFFHAQAAERIAFGDVYLGHGAFTDGLDPAAEEAADLANARRIVEVLSSHGLTVDWTGSMAQNVRVVLPDWRRRLPAREDTPGEQAA